MLQNSPNAIANNWFISFKGREIHRFDTSPSILSAAGNQRSINYAFDGIRKGLQCLCPRLA